MKMDVSFFSRFQKTTFLSKKILHVEYSVYYAWCRYANGIGAMIRYKVNVKIISSVSTVRVDETSSE